MNRAICLRPEGADVYSPGRKPWERRPRILRPEGAGVPVELRRPLRGGRIATAYPGLPPRARDVGPLGAKKWHIHRSLAGFPS